MDLEQRIAFIQSVFDRIDIYYSLVVYPDDLDEEFGKLQSILVTDDFPIFSIRAIGTLDSLDFIESHYRMLFMTDSTFEQYLKVKKDSMSNVSVIFSACEPLFSRKYHGVLEGVHLFPI
jgi:hypothetical protein